MEMFRGMDSFANPNAEKCAISGFLLSEKAARLSRELAVDDFTSPATRAVFAAIQRLLTRQERVDLVTVDAELAALGQREHSMALVEFSKMAPSAANTEAYMALIKDRTVRRRIRDIAQQALDAIHDPGVETGFVLGDERQALRDIGVTKHGWVEAGELMMDTYGYIEDLSMGRIVPIKTGIGALDKIIGGFYPGELTIIGARPAVGKSAFALNIAVAAAKAGKKVCVASLEMSAHQFGQRMFAKGSGVNGMNLRTGRVDEDAWMRLAEAMRQYSELPMSFLFTAKYLEDIVIEAQKKRDNGELDMLIVDYLQLIKVRKKFESRRVAVGHISGELKQLSKELNVPVIALAQLSRPEKGKIHVPQMADLKESGDIEQDADGIILLHRVEKNGELGMDERDAHAFETYTSEGRQYIALRVDKQRQGSVGKLATIFNPANMEYRAIVRDQIRR